MNPSTRQYVKYENGTNAYWKGEVCDIDPINSCVPNPCKGNPAADYVALYGQAPKGLCKDLVNGYAYLQTLIHQL